MKTFADFNISIPAGATGQITIPCPQCSHTRRKSRVGCLSVNVEDGVWCCHHCDWSGSLGIGSDKRPQPRPQQYRRPSKSLEIALSDDMVRWFAARGITEPVLRRNRVERRRVYMRQLEDMVDAIAFPYFRNGELINVKYRAISKKVFSLEPQCELVLYGLDDIKPDEPLIWVEGECDKLALEVAGFKNVVSVPNGAPPPEAKNYSALFKFLEADEAKIQSVKRHVLAVDGDAVGKHLESELSRRLGADKCSRVHWPELVKDANEMLVKHGPVDLAWYIENAEPFPIEGVFGPDDLKTEIYDLYEKGLTAGLSTGWKKLDAYYTVRQREVTVVTGIPGSGKSNFIDCLLVNLAREHGWNFAIFSPENLPLEEHMARVTEKYFRKPFADGPTPRMTRSELEAALEWVKEHFKWIAPDDENLWTVDKIIETARQLPPVAHRQLPRRQLYSRQQIRRPTTARSVRII
jgi:twinkle protein